VTGELVIADVSEFQPGIDWRAYAAATPAVIVRAHNGRRPDHLWEVNATEAGALCRWWGAYQYLPADVDAALAARRLRDCLGDHRPNVTILDLEEGAGDQQPRQHAWLAALADDDIADWTYTGDYFARAHGLDVEWVAAYQQREPTRAHKLWQFTNAQRFAGIPNPCDGSVFHGSIDDLLAITGGHHQEDDMAQVPQDEWAQVNMIVHALQADMDDLKARTPSREQLDAIIGPDDGMQVTLARIEAELRALSAELTTTFRTLTGGR
jgi:hypothetical protein